MNLAALQFSGGKDSLALVYFMQALWPFCDVIFMDTGDALPETIERVEEVKGLVPKFTWLKSDSLAYRKEHGDPNRESWIRCCVANVYKPMHEYVLSQGYRQIIRGTKAIDPHLHLVFPGDVLDGILYTFPLWHWTDRDVMQYLGDKLPKPYKMGAIGMPDCATCTATEMCGGSTKVLWYEQTSLGIH